MFGIFKSEEDEILKEIEKNINICDDAYLQNSKLLIFTKNAPDLIDSIEEKFVSETKLSKEDAFFIFVATALQCLRIYFMNQLTKPVDDQVAAKSAHKIHDRLIDAFDDCNTSQGWYKASEREILSPTVPFDIMAGSKQYSIGGIDKGLSGKNIYDSGKPKCFLLWCARRYGQ